MAASLCFTHDKDGTVVSKGFVVSLKNMNRRLTMSGRNFEVWIADRHKARGEDLKNYPSVTC